MPITFLVINRECFILSPSDGGREGGRERARGREGMDNDRSDRRP